MTVFSPLAYIIMSYRQSAVRDLHTIKDFVRWTYSRFQSSTLFYGHGTDNSWDEAVQLVLGALKLPPDFDKSLMDCNLTIDEKKRILSLVHTRITKRLPLAYLFGEAWLAGLPFYITQDTLIPRSPIAFLLENQLQPWLAHEPNHILDMCTGSGCLGIIAALVFENAQVDLSDISEQALVVAQSNIERHELQGRVSTIESNIFSALAGKTYDLILCNPPYVDQQDYDSAPEEFKHEPQLALTSGADGLDFMRLFLQEVASHLNDEGIIICEVGNTEIALQKAFPSAPFIWLELENGGNGVFMMSKNELLAHFK